VADLGLDQIMIYRLDFENQQLIPNIIPSLTLQPGSGPRHFVFHPNGKFAYVTQELGSLISALAYDSSTGGLELLQTVSMLPEGFSGENFAADLHVSPSGRFLYGSNRGHDSIVIFTVDEQTGQLTLLSHHATNGHWPRNFVIDPTGNFLLVGNQYSGTINSFRLDQDTGLMQDTKYVTQIPAPACLKMIRF
jgi:6-phosphogluconolactonase